MKRSLRITSLIVVLVMAVLAFASCTFGEEKVTVTWYDGDQVVKTEEVDKGSTVSKWTPEKEGLTFAGWYKNPEFNAIFNFNAPINEDTSIYAAFVSGDFQADETEYYLVGSGIGDLMYSNWSQEDSRYEYIMYNDNIPGKNSFSIEILMFAGDAFLICHDGSWDGQVGIGKVEGVELETDTHAIVKDADGEVVFEGFEEFGNTYDKWNITLTEGHDGVYRFTYTTDPANPDSNIVTWELVRSVDSSEAPVFECEMYFIGSFNGWSTTYEDGSDYMLYDNGDGTWEGSLEITENMYTDDAIAHVGYPAAALKLYDAANDKWIGYEGDGDLFLTAGVYSFVYNSSTRTFTYEVLEGGEIPEIKDDGNYSVYLVGTMNDDESGTWLVSEDFALVKSADNKTWSITITVTEDMYRDWTVAEGGKLSAAFKVYNKTKNEWIGVSGGNLYLEAGTYEIVYHADGNYIEYRDPNNSGTGGSDTTDGITVYFKNTDNWSYVYTWIWIDGGENFTGGTWPGKAMTPVAGADGWYSYTVNTTSTAGLKLIFSNKGAPQTADLVYSGLNYWVGTTGYATMEEANAAAEGLLSKSWSNLYIRGSMNSWGTSNRLELDEDGNAWIVISLSAGDTFKIADADWATQYNAESIGDNVNFTEGPSDQNIQVVNAGEYKITVTADGELIMEKQ